MSDSYSYLKALRHPEVLHSIKQGIPSALPHVELILADLCQQSCRFCAYRLEGYTSNQLFNDQNMMPTGKALEIVKDCSEMGVRAIQFTGGGEPTLHKGFGIVVQEVLSKGMKFSLVSNGVRIDENLAPLVAKASWVRISLDAATPETYCSTRRVPVHHFTKAKEAIRFLKQNGCPVLGVGFVVTPDNWKEIYDAAWLAKSLGADNIRISAQFSQEDEKLFAAFHKEASRLAKSAEALTSKSFTVFNRFADRLEDLTLKHPEDALCGYQFFTTYIGADLNVYRCCGYAYNERGLMGSLKEQSFKQFWMSQTRFDEQKRFDGRGCERCQFRSINKTLAYVLDESPRLHEEFV